MNSAPVSHAGASALRHELARRKTPEQARMMEAIAASQEYLAGDVDAEAAYYRIHFASAVGDPDLQEDLIRRLRVAFTSNGVVRARQIEEQLYEQTWSSESYDLTAQLRRLRVPTVVIHGERDLVPVEIAEHIAASIPDAQLEVLPDCGHFAYLEQPDHVHRLVEELLSV
jgi:proline iminopeptidase